MHFTEQEIDINLGQPQKTIILLYFTSLRALHTIIFSSIAYMTNEINGGMYVSLCPCIYPRMLESPQNPYNAHLVRYSGWKRYYR